MKKIFLEYNEYLEMYWILNKGLSCHQELIYLWESFNPLNDWISVKKEDDGWVTIWSYWDMKDKKDKNFISQQEETAYDKAYDQYWWKRYVEIPKLELTQQNYDDLVEQWEKINEENKTKYVVIVQDDLGTVFFELQDVLSQEDQKYIAQDLERYNSFIEKLKAYKLFSRSSQKWCGPDDSVFYSDFLTPDEMLWKSRKF